MAKMIVQLLTACALLKRERQRNKLAAFTKQYGLTLRPLRLCCGGPSAASAFLIFFISLRSRSADLREFQIEPRQRVHDRRATTSRANGLLSAGTTYQGACSRLVARIASS